MDIFAHFSVSMSRRPARHCGYNSEQEVTLSLNEDSLLTMGPNSPNIVLPGQPQLLFINDHLLSRYLPDETETEYYTVEERGKGSDINLPLSQ